MNIKLTRTFLVSLSLLLWIAPAAAQKKKKEKIKFERSPKQELVYANKTYLPAIQNVQFYPVGKENETPIYEIGSGEPLLLRFDDLRSDVRNYYLSIEHCDRDWTPSRTSVLDYVEGFNEDRIDDYRLSQNTYQHYTAYSVTFPTEYIKPKLAGNYILKVYEDADKARLILTRRFYVLNNLVQIESNIQASANVSNRLRNQKLNVQLKTGLTIQNPQRDLSVLVRQNHREDTQMLLEQPSFIGNNDIRYTNSATLDFKANNEFRFVDLRSFRVASERVLEMWQDSITHIILRTDENNHSETYAATYDENGRFYTRNRDFNDEDIDGDYAAVTFSLKANEDIKGDIYLVGGFNNFQRNPENKLSYDAELKLWSVTVKLKQGLYDYEYVLETPNGQIVSDAFSGSHYDTGNDYQIFIYHRRMGTYWDELVGFSENSINNKK